MEVIQMYFQPNQIKKLKQGKTVQLTATAMLNKNQGQLIELKMLKKFANQIKKAINTGKSWLNRLLLLLN